MNICYWNIHKNHETQNDEFNKFVLKMLIDKSIDLFCVSGFDKLKNVFSQIINSKKVRIIIMKRKGKQ